MIPKRITLKSTISHLKGDWYLWEAKAEMPDGTVREGIVEADSQGMTIAQETFEEE